MQHPLNRHLFIADNIYLLRRLDNESVDLICIDPPFSKNQTFVGNLNPPLTEAERDWERETLAGWGIHTAADAENAGIEWPEGQNNARFQDIWRWENDVHEDWISRIEDDYPALATVIEATRHAHSEGMAAYIAYMAIRIIEMRRVLKSTGSVYLHCDSTASRYLATLMDTVFGRDNFGNEIIWQRNESKGLASRRLPRNHDTILRVTKSSHSTWNPPYIPHNLEEAQKQYTHKDQDGRLYQLTSLTNPNHNRPNLTYEFLGVTRVWRWTKERMQEAYEAGQIVQTRPGAVPRFKRYLDEQKGIPVDDIWTDIKPLQAQSTERTGYPTQKPVALAERIILASSNPGDVVLDCFAGCAYVPVAAERNGRQWIACDISPRALTVLRRQFAKFQYAVDGSQNAEQPALMVAANVITRSPHDLPERTDTDPAERQDIKELPEIKFKVPSSIIPEKEMLEHLLKLSGYQAWCCGFANRMSSGVIVETANNFHLDHIDPKSKDGSNQIWNRAPLCPTHNVRKSNRRVHLAEYREEIANAGEMLVDSTAALINLAWAEQQAVDYYAAARARQPHS